MANRLYVKDGIHFEGISMRQGRSSRSIKIIGFSIFALAVLGLVAFTGMSYFSGNNKSSSNNIPVVTILPTSSRQITDIPTATPIQKVSGIPTPTLSLKPLPSTSVKTDIKKSSVTIAVLNGSGEKGAAKGMSTLLTNAGYSVSQTGNADAFTYKNVTITIKKGKSQYLDQLKKDIVADGFLISSSSATMTESAATDAVVIVGAN